MKPTEYANAWEHPATRWSWARHMTGTVVGQILWIVSWFACLFLAVFTPLWTLIAWVPLLGYTMYRAVVQLLHFSEAVRIQRILWQYPWQQLREIPHGLANHPDAKEPGPWFSLCNPVRPDEQIPMVMYRHIRTTWWNRRMAPRAAPELKAQLNELWFAGDPRFVGVLALPGPRRFLPLDQRPCFDPRYEPISWGAAPADLERARRAGAIVAG